MWKTKTPTCSQNERDREGKLPREEKPAIGRKCLRVLVPSLFHPEPCHFQGTSSPAMIGNVSSFAADDAIAYMNVSENTDRTCIVVVQVASSARTTIHLGLIVDSVDEVSNITSSDIENTPDFGIQLDSSYLIGMAKIKNRVVSLLNIDRCLGAEDLEAVQKTVEN